MTWRRWLAEQLRWLHAPWTHLSDMQRDIASIRVTLLQVSTRTDLNALEARMAAREDASYEKLTTDLTSVKEGWASLIAERDQYKDALEQADADKAAAVSAALDADSEHDADKIDAADAIIAGLLAPAPESEPTPEPEPAPVEEPPADQPA